jgi:hypothetical protein
MKFVMILLPGHFKLTMLYPARYCSESLNSVELLELADMYFDY